jgi:hypothetical protein
MYSDVQLDCLVTYHLVFSLCVTLKLAHCKTHLSNGGHYELKQLQTQLTCKFTIQKSHKHANSLKQTETKWNKPYPKLPKQVQCALCFKKCTFFFHHLYAKNTTETYKLYP